MPVKMKLVGWGQPAVTICAAGLGESLLLWAQKSSIKFTPILPLDPVKHSKAQEISKFTAIKCVFKYLYGSALGFVNMFQPLGTSAMVKYRKCAILLLQSSLYESEFILWGCTNKHPVYLGLWCCNLFFKNPLNYHLTLQSSIKDNE